MHKIFQKNLKARIFLKKNSINEKIKVRFIGEWFAIWSHDNRSSYLLDVKMNNFRLKSIIFISNDS